MQNYSIFVPEYLRKIGPDLCYMALIVSSYNILMKETRAHVFAGEIADTYRNSDLFRGSLFSYAIFCLICWVVCIYLFKEFTKKRVGVNSTLSKSLYWAGSVMFGFIMFIVSAYLQ